MIDRKKTMLTTLACILTLHLQGIQPSIALSDPVSSARKASQIIVDYCQPWLTPFAITAEEISQGPLVATHQELTELKTNQRSFCRLSKPFVNLAGNPEFAVCCCKTVGSYYRKGPVVNFEVLPDGSVRPILSDTHKYILHPTTLQELQGLWSQPEAALPTHTFCTLAVTDNGRSIQGHFYDYQEVTLSYALEQGQASEIQEALLPQPVPTAQTPSSTSSSSTLSTTTPSQENAPADLSNVQPKNTGQ